MRYLNSNSTIDRLSTFGMTEENFKKVNHMMSMPHGIIYVTGPTGSGKTTTLYMILEKLAQGQINISTIEDPVERKLVASNAQKFIQQEASEVAVGEKINYMIKQLLRRGEKNYVFR